MGSSLGGFYATWLAEKNRVPRGAPEPGGAPLGACPGFSGVSRRHTAESAVVITRTTPISSSDRILQRLQCLPAISCMLSIADEVLDWHEAGQKIPDGERVLVPQGDHQISNFDQQFGNNRLLRHAPLKRCLRRPTQTEFGCNTYAVIFLTTTAPSGRVCTFFDERNHQVELFRPESARREGSKVFFQLRAAVALRPHEKAQAQAAELDPSFLWEVAPKDEFSYEGSGG